MQYYTPNLPICPWGSEKVCYDRPNVKSSSNLTYRPQPEEVVAAVASLYADCLKPYGRILLRRVGERAKPVAEAKGLDPNRFRKSQQVSSHASGGGSSAQEDVLSIDSRVLRRVCERCPELYIECDSGSDYIVYMVGWDSTFVDATSGCDPYPMQMWQDARAYFGSLSGDSVYLPGGRYGCAVALLEKGLGFLAGRSLGEICHILHLAISRHNILGYADNHIVPYGHSDKMAKERCAETQSRMISSKKVADSAMPLANWEQAQACLRELLASSTSYDHEGLGTLPLPNVKRLFRSRFGLELSETVLGHARLCELLQDARFHDICTLRRQGCGYLVVEAAKQNQLLLVHSTAAEPLEEPVDEDGWSTDDGFDDHASPSKARRSKQQPQQLLVGNSEDIGNVSFPDACNGQATVYVPVAVLGSPMYSAATPAFSAATPPPYSAPVESWAPVGISFEQLQMFMPYSPSHAPSVCGSVASTADTCRGRGHTSSRRKRNESASSISSMRSQSSLWSEMTSDDDSCSRPARQHSQSTLSSFSSHSRSRSGQRTSSGDNSGKTFPRQRSLSNSSRCSKNSGRKQNSRSHATSLIVPTVKELQQECDAELTCQDTEIEIVFDSNPDDDEYDQKIEGALKAAGVDLESMGGDFKDPVAAVTTSSGKVFSSETNPDFDTDDLLPEDFPIKIRMVLQKQRHLSAAGCSHTPGIHEESSDEDHAMHYSEVGNPSSKTTSREDAWKTFPTEVAEPPAEESICSTRKDTEPSSKEDMTSDSLVCPLMCSAPKDMEPSSKEDMSSDSLVCPLIARGRFKKVEHPSTLESRVSSCNSIEPTWPDKDFDARSNAVEWVQLSPWEMFEEVVESMRTSLLAIDAVVDAESVEGARGWTLTLYVLPEELKIRRKALTEVAQKTLLAIAERSATVYVLGYCATPFVPMSMGFGAALANMADPEHACWNTYSKGFCRRPGSCCFKHPTSQAGLKVAFRPARPA